MQNKHKLILAVLLITALFVRTYRTEALLRFYYDQGRDALVIHEMIKTPKPVLVGPTTGLAGILRGPFFYYLLLPGYLIGQGSPVVAAIWLQAINLIGLYFIYLTAKNLFSPLAGLISVFLFGFSNQLVSLSRWLSNPSPIFTTVPIMLFALIQIIKAKSRVNPWGWYAITALMLGLNLQLEIASEIWFIPAVVLFFLFQKKYWPSVKTLFLSIGIFLATLIPQVVFDFRHQHIMLKAVKDHFAASQAPSFVFSRPQLVERWRLFQDTFAAILVPRDYLYLALALILIVSVLLSGKKTRPLKSLLFWLILFPLLVLSFYQGNQGNFYSYYLIGLFPPFIILFSGGITHLFKKSNWALVSLAALFLFIKPNFNLLKNFLIAGYDGPEHISLGNQLQAVDWVYSQTGDQDFNIDTYVPPVIPYAYDYLFLWYGQKRYGYQPSQDLKPLLFTIAEVDPPHPERLQAWMDRQAGIGEVKKQTRFGGIMVERRSRYSGSQ